MNILRNNDFRVVQHNLALQIFSKVCMPMMKETIAGIHYKAESKFIYMLTFYAYCNIYYWRSNISGEKANAIS